MRDSERIDKNADGVKERDESEERRRTGCEGARRERERERQREREGERERQRER